MPSLRDLIYYVRDDRRGYLWIFLLACIAATVFFFARPRQVKVVTVVRDGKEGDYRSAGGGSYYAVKAREVHLRTFDPNTADSTLLLDLGLQPWQVRAIYRYRAAGGVYSRPEDFARLYGLSVKKYRELRPYIIIGEDYRPASEVYGNNSRDKHHTNGRAVGSTGGMDEHSTNGRAVGSTSGGARVSEPSGERQNAALSATGKGALAMPPGNGYPQKLRAGQTISVNSSDTMELRRVPGIGPYFARRIVRYRDQLGGFVSKEQLLEISDFPESALPYLVVSPTDGIKKLNVNKATNEQLRRHPYISYYMARCICDYRRMRGNIRDLNDLRLLPGFSPEVIAKLRGYVEY